MLSSWTPNSTYEDSYSRNFFVATQDKEFRQQLRRIPGVPIMYLNKVILILEPPSDASKEFRNELESRKTSLPESETAALLHLNEGTNNTNHPIINDELNNSHSLPTVALLNPVIERKKRKAIAPNPLSNKTPEKDSHATKKKKMNIHKRR
eukprot:CAMPEP_0182418306 /NCGR_PEP_ID=MMETSP1167-20130531/2776_1 /TAXON_ID=2988 /ORGANISM="Mallomonas Sp, Strain CCMP3275" /LENGTH=150 /DNA_ID=CAMNT_0024592453 /DNA_START=333 /DNA_END=785 /DNA_ORIENTATION=-